MDEYVIVELGANSLRTVAYRVMMRKNNRYRAVEVVLRKNQDITEYVTENKARLWRDGVEISKREFINAKESQYVGYYAAVVSAVMAALIGGGTLAQANVAGIAALEEDSGKLAEWGVYRTALNAVTEQDIHRAMMDFCGAGLMLARY